MRRVRALFVTLLCVVGLCLPLEAAEARYRSTPALDRPIERSSSVVFTGRARPRAVVRLQARGSARWVTVRTARTTRTGAYRFATRYPSRTRRYRVVSLRRASTSRLVSPRRVVQTPAPTPPPPPSDECGVQPRRADGSYYACTFHDEFSGDSLDTTKWLVQETWYSGMTSGHKDCYVNDDQTVAVAGGTLALTARRHLEPFTCKSPFGDFQTTSTASTVATRNHFNQAYGRFSFRVRFPQANGPGLHSAAWLYPREHSYGAWPHSGEIDVAEWFSGVADKVFPSVHYAGENPLLSSGYDCVMPTASTAFHTYTVDWTPERMTFSYDGKVCYTHAWTPLGLTGSQPFDKPFYVVLTQVWGSQWNAPDLETADVATFEVDWVRAWQ